jgi:anti-sigma factor (TIGR02949 family)
MELTTSMSCDEVRACLTWLVDDELDASQTLTMEQHLQGCRECSGTLEAQRRLGEVLKEASRKQRAPVRLAQKVRTLVKKKKPSVWFWPALPRWSLALVGAAALVLFGVFGQNRGQSELEVNQLMAHHARNLPMDVVASNPQEVKRYLGSYLPFVPRLPALTQEASNFGGRVTRINNRDTAYLHYSLPRGRLSVFVYQAAPSELQAKPSSYTIGGGQRVHLQRLRGYTVIRWVRDGLTYSMISDLSEPELFGAEGYLKNLRWH